MDTFLIVFCLSILLALTCLLVLLAEQRKLILQLRAEQRSVAEMLRRDQAAELSEFIQSQPGPIITIEILNAVEVAAQSSIIGGLVAKIAPDTIHRIVVKRTADTMRSQMTEHGVEVQVLVHDHSEDSA